MSGIEIAGLALGAFPVLLSVLENYRRAAEKLDDWWKIQRAYKEWHQDLDYHKTTFEINIKLILVPLMDDDEVSKLIDDPGGELWRDDGLKVMIKERLPESYDTVMDIVVSINDLIRSLRKELGVENPNLQERLNQQRESAKGKAAVRQFFGTQNIDFQKERFRLVFSRTAREHLSSQLQKANDRLRGLLEGGDQVASARSRKALKPSPAVNKRIQEYWRHAKRLYDALSNAAKLASSGTASCQCAGHYANLQLQEKDSDKAEFGVLFGGMKRDGSLGWKETRIEMFPNSDPAATNIPPASTGRTQRQVGFVVESDAQASSRAIQSHLRPIHSLCKALSNPRCTCFGFMDEDDHRFVVYPEAMTPASSRISIHTLDNVIQAAQPLTRRKRYSLAHTIALWFLRLGSTPWIDLPIQANIMFFEDATHPSGMNFDAPYIGGELSSFPSSTATDAIRSLGICLLELCFGFSLERYKLQNQITGSTGALGSALDYAIALQWSKEVNEEAGYDFADAIDWCLQPRSLNDDSWRKEIWGGVIVPLHTCCEQVSQKPSVTGG